MILLLNENALKDEAVKIPNIFLEILYTLNIPNAKITRYTVFGNAWVSSIIEKYNH